MFRRDAGIRLGGAIGLEGTGGTVTSLASEPGYGGVITMFPLVQPAMISTFVLDSVHSTLCRRTRSSSPRSRHSRSGTGARSPRRADVQLCRAVHDVRQGAAVRRRRGRRADPRRGSPAEAQGARPQGEALRRRGVEARTARTSCWQAAARSSRRTRSCCRCWPPPTTLRPSRRGSRGIGLRRHQAGTRSIPRSGEGPEPPRPRSSPACATSCSPPGRTQNAAPRARSARGRRCSKRRRRSRSGSPGSARSTPRRSGVEAPQALGQHHDAGAHVGRRPGPCTRPRRGRSTCASSRRR